MKGDHNQEEHYNAEELLPFEVTQTDMEEKQGYPNQRSTAAESSTDGRKQIKGYSGHQ